MKFVDEFRNEALVKSLVKKLQKYSRKDINIKEYKIINEYKRVVKAGGNTVAVQYRNEVFDIVDSAWRGIGLIPKSGYVFNKDYEEFDALKDFQIEYEKYDGNSDCRCGDSMSFIQKNMYT